MDEDNDTPSRVTRARTRRISNLDTASRSSTPMFDLPADRASPRPLRRKRYNSTNADTWTPTRTTRLTVARGQTPEPITPASGLLSASKRPTRTPAKSVRKQLTLKEDENDSQPKAKPNSSKIEALTDAAIHSTFDTPDVGDNRRVTRSMSKTPPSVYKSANNSSSEEKLEQNISNVSMATEVVEAPIENATKDSSMSTNSDKSVNKGNVEVKLEVKLKDINKSLIAKDDEPALHDSCDEELTKSFVAIAEENEETDEADVAVVPQADESSVAKSLIAKDAKPALHESLEEDPKKSSAAEDSFEEELTKSFAAIAEESDEADVAVVPQPEESSVAKSLIATDDKPALHESLEDLKKSSAAEDSFEEELTKSFAAITEESDEADVAVVPQPDDPVGPETEQSELKEEPKRSLTFQSVMSIDLAKRTYPKTPARLVVPKENVYNMAESESPLKSMTLKGRNSSTPLAKSETFLSQEKDGSKPEQSELPPPPPPPPQIDVIIPLTQLEAKEPEREVQPTKGRIARRLVSDDESEDDEGNQFSCDFIHQEVEVIKDYQSGDSMDSSELREMEQNEIQVEGESVGSQDTTDGDCSQESGEDNLSFVVSDDDDDDKIDALYYSSLSSESSEIDSSPKKRARIIAPYSSEDESHQGGAVEEAMEIEEEQREDENVSHEDLVFEEALQIEEEQPKDEDVSPEDSVFEEALQIEEEQPKVEDVFPKDSVFEEALQIEEEQPKDEYVSPEDSVFEVVGEQSTCDEGDLEEEHINTNDKTTFEILCSEVETSADNEEPKKDEIEKSLAKADPTSKIFGSKVEADEQKLLDELSSCDLSHLQQMFNPLQKSRRQTLFVQEPEKVAQKRKNILKRRSDHLNSDVKPSQSFIQSLAESQQSKRQRLSKSFCGAAETLDASAEVEDTLSKEAAIDDPVATGSEMNEPVELDQAEPSTAAHAESTAAQAETTAAQAQLEQEVLLQEHEAGTEETEQHYQEYYDAILQESSKKAQKIAAAKPEELPAAEAELCAQPKVDAQQKKNVEKPNEPKSVVHYLTYCEDLLQAANEAKLEQKKKNIAAGKQQKSRPRAADATGSANANKETTSIKPKKNVKRLQATQQAVKHAVRLLTVDKEDKTTKSLARKLSPQPETNKKGAKVGKKKTAAKVSPVKSSDEENHYANRHIKNSAGYVVVTALDPEESAKTVIMTTCGPFTVEPTTPKQKYFREIPGTPKNHSGFKELPISSKTSKRKAPTGGNQNHATESALRFKRQIFARSNTKKSHN